MQTPELQTFVDAGKSKGASDEFLAALLTRRGWPADDVYAALASHWEAATGLAIPQRGGAGESARDAFLYLLSFSTLATWAAALASILFELINRWLPDAVSRGNLYSDFRSLVTWQMASMLVAFPIYLLSMRTLTREAAEHPERLQSGVRKWLTYIALLVTAGTMICDLICFLDYFLMGELTARFVLKVLAVLAISGSIFTYYLGWLKGRRTRGRAFAIAAAAAVGAVFAIGLAAAGTPARQRQLEADRTRAQDLRNLATAIRGAHGAAGRMPPNLGALGTSRRLRLEDPETRRPYEYSLEGGSRYALCARFAADSSEDSGLQFRPGSFWNHGPGRVCFQLDAALVAPW